MWLHENINVIFNNVYALREKIKLNRSVIGEKRRQNDTDDRVIINMKGLLSRGTRDLQISKFMNYDESCVDEIDCRNTVVAREACSVIVDKICFPIDFQETY